RYSNFGQNVPRNSIWSSKPVRTNSNLSFQHISSISTSLVKSDAWNESINIHSNSKKSFISPYYRIILIGLGVSLLVGRITLATITIVWLKSIDVTVTDPIVVANIALVLRTSTTYGLVTTNGRSWIVGTYGSGSELSANGSVY
ncbi:unnamed protein product, partial [Rotaria sordida]